MMKNMHLELYTRPTCSDCQDAKAYLAKHNILYIDHDLSKEPEKERTLIKLSGARMVPTFVFKDKSLCGWMSKPKVLIGFEMNYEEIVEMLNN
ncbi:glutaredoxin family protein [Sporosarcina sp. FSL K6-1522]|uniref:glutaredoxin family protein n=1 Tax=Sporosarcina sp. FSL K6-1522 TaxID=2921554 RepID=UPI00315B234E